MSNLEEKIVFGVAPEGQGDGAPIVLLGIPKGAWEYMKDGKTHSFDLTKIGIPVKILIYGADRHATAMKVIEDHMATQGAPYLDERDKDFSIKPKRAKEEKGE